MFLSVSVSVHLSVSVSVFLSFQCSPQNISKGVAKWNALVGVVVSHMVVVI